MHFVVDLFEVEGPELIPLGQNENGVRVFASFISAFAIADELVVCGDTEIFLNLRNFHLRVINRDVSQLFNKVLANIDGGGFARIIGILLEGEAENGDLLIRNCVEHRRDDPATKALLLVVVHFDHTVPVGGDFGQAKVFAQVDEI